MTPRSLRGGMLVALALTGVLLLLALLPPFVGAAWRAALMQVLHTLCHQLPERSFHVGGVPMGVCHRCTGIYVGLFAGTLLFPLIARADAWLWENTRWLLVASLVPMGVDWAGDALGLFVNTPASRTLTGAAFGLWVSYLLVRGLAGLFTTPHQARPEDARQAVTPSPHGT